MTPNGRNSHRRPSESIGVGRKSQAPSDLLSIWPRLQSRLRLCSNFVPLPLSSTSRHGVHHPGSGGEKSSCNPRLSSAAADFISIFSDAENVTFPHNSIEISAPGKGHLCPNNRDAKNVQERLAASELSGRMPDKVSSHHHSQVIPSRFPITRK